MSRPPEPREFARSIEHKLDEHIKECMELSLKTTQALVDQTAAIQQTNNALVAIDHKFTPYIPLLEVLRRVGGVAEWLLKYGRRLIVGVVGIILTAWVSVLAQNYFLLQSTAKVAESAATAAQATDAKTDRIQQTLSDIAGASK